MISAQRVSVIWSWVNRFDWAMKYDWRGSSRPSAKRPIARRRPVNLKRLNANAADAPNRRTSVTDTAVTIALLTAYWPMLPTSHAFAQFARSIDSGRANGDSKIARSDLKLESTIQTIGKKNSAAIATIAAPTSHLARATGRRFGARWH